MKKKKPTTHWSTSGHAHCKTKWTTWCAAGITDNIKEVGCWHCRRYLMNPNHWSPGKQPNYPKQWDIELKAKKEKAQ